MAYKRFGIQPTAPSTDNQGFIRTTLIQMIRDPEIRGRSGSEQFRRSIGLSSSGHIGHKQILRWVALNVTAWMRSRGVDPGLSVEKVSSSPGFGIVYDIEMNAAARGVVSAFRVVVEEMPDEAFRLSIVSLDDNGSLPFILRTVFKNMPNVAWTSIGRPARY